MNENFYQPLQYIPDEASDMPVIFLAGPIQGTGDWQAEARKMFHQVEVGKKGFLNVF